MKMVFCTAILFFLSNSLLDKFFEKFQSSGMDNEQCAEKFHQYFNPFELATRTLPELRAMETIAKRVVSGQSL